MCSPHLRRSDKSFLAKCCHSEKLVSKPLLSHSTCTGYDAAVEATSLNDRAFNRLLPQDAFIRDNIEANDVLVVSVVGLCTLESS